jgi:3-dehydroquinate dehydratase
MFYVKRTNHTVIFHAHCGRCKRALQMKWVILNGENFNLKERQKQSYRSAKWNNLTKYRTGGIRRKRKEFNVISSNYNEDNTLNIRVHGSENQTKVLSLHLA